MNIDLRPGMIFDPDNPVRLYRNLHRGSKTSPVYSVQQQGPKGWRVIGYTDALALMLPHFEVSQAGRRRVIKTKKKAVHAYIVGWAVELTPSEWNRGWRGVTYNPYKHTRFVYRDTETHVIVHPNYAVINADGVHVA